MRKIMKFNPIAAGIMLACGASLVQAQGQLEEVTVTAQKREQSLQEVPVAVTAFGEDQLLENGVADLTDIQKLTPNTTLQVSRGTNSTLTAYIRGIGQQDPLWGFEPGVGIYVDDIYVARPQGAVMDVFDVERIEVLRGPQGTLYGKNTIGGAVKYVTKKLSGDTEFRIRGGLGSYNQRDLVLSGQTGLSDTAAIGFAVASYQRDGFGENVNTGAENYNKDILSARVSLEFNPNEDLFIRLAADTTQDDSNARFGHLMFDAPTGAETPLDDVYDNRSNMSPDNSVETSGMSLTAEWNVSDSVTVKSITASRSGDTDTAIDFDSVDRPDFDVPAYYKDEQFTQEFQVNWSGDKFNLVSGLYYYDGNAEGGFDAVLGMFGITQNVSGNVDTQSLAAYANYEYFLTDKLNMTLGGRYTRDEKSAEVFKGNYLGLYSPMFADRYDGTPAGGTPYAILTDYSNSKTWSQFDPKAGLNYQINDDTMVYGSFSSGFKSGGFDMRGDAVATPSTVDGYDPETAETFELGIKTQLLDDRVRLNAAAFSTDYEDMQVTVQSFDEASQNFTSAVVNAGQSKIQGLELEMLASITDRLTANVVLGYTDADYKEVLTYDAASDSIVNVADVWKNFQYSPERTGLGQLSYAMDMAGGELVLNGSVSYRDSIQIYAAPSDLDVGSVTLVDAGATYFSGNGDWQVSLQGKNLNDETYRNAGYNAFGWVTGYYGNPRTVALTGSYNF
ncbi:TonB-dependent receptor [Microbulbifer hydrolyticus]|uniref:Iron complex outermembrane receptor protein n=1 Tax=Microbulbifer hydrolyticus TaxID=48074 RepID=A0A6P1T4Y4_9GAMM|nr:TonB-dependent receptor [Microbulbifer hydrolyticus]MBB5211437.1 iron complex outermembrane receptor protein [Microbulbifer hydrolyticus]QHQ37808.1 TonB-dependent receptor [Microbulbifer hydrolyticus]